MAKMRIDIKTLKKINKEFGPYEIGSDGQDKLYFRFGYWEYIESTKLAALLPAYLNVQAQLVDEDSDCGALWVYNVWDNRFKTEEKHNYKQEQKYKLVSWSLIGLAACVIYILLDKYIF